MPSQIPTPEQVMLRHGHHDPYAPTQPHQQPNVPPLLDPLWPLDPTMNPLQQADGLPPTAQDFGIPPAPGMPAPPPRKRRAGLLALISVVLVVLLVGAVVGYVVLRPGSTATSTCSLAGYTTFTSTDHTFCLVYPTGWQVTNALEGSGAQFSGPARQFFTAANIGAVSSTPMDYDVGFCNSLAGRLNAIATVTLSGQNWTQARCGIDNGAGRVVVEAVIYHGQLYHMGYGSSSLTFLSNQSQTFGPMEQSFRFL